MQCSKSDLRFSLDEISKKLAEAPDDARQLIKRVDGLVDAAHSADPAAKLRSLKQQASGDHPIHEPLLAIIKTSTSVRPAREDPISSTIQQSATVTFWVLLQHGYPFQWQPKEATELFAALEQLLPPPYYARQSLLDHAIFRLVTAATTQENSMKSMADALVTGTLRAGATTDLREVILRKHEAFIRRAEALLKIPPYDGGAFMFLTMLFSPRAPASAHASQWMRLLGKAMDICLDEAHVAERGEFWTDVLAEVMTDGAIQNIPKKAQTGRQQEVLQAVEDHLIPHMPRLVEALTTSRDAKAKRRAACLIGATLCAATATLRSNPHQTNKDRRAVSNGEVRRVRTIDLLIEETDVATAVPPSRLQYEDGTPFPPVEVAMASQAAINFNVILLLAVPSYLTLPVGLPDECLRAVVAAGFVPAVMGLVRNEQMMRVQKFWGGALMDCISITSNIARRDDKVACDKSIVSTVCDLLLKHAKSDICISSQDTFGCIGDIIRAFVGFGDLQVERKKLATNVFRLYVLRLPSVQQLIAEPQDPQLNLPEGVALILRWLDKNPTNFRLMSAVTDVVNAHLFKDDNRDDKNAD
ncbi:unnamed protein product [Vitrella brassicaformis CCMP3155]|uniref:Uncharacterized protein n=1 Tax=Vitrella brassicaformis (strain CCMP3155) TaxID=1169540 RepID=A0A0G4G7I5_VITBC|nr:unnamed protein product [Vitrella brassicaformis CCMP3155]|eukprot:CEM24364.1 unnamed protein product [Vitrella brassicaformis CCMP3155]